VFQQEDCQHLKLFPRNPEIRHYQQQQQQKKHIKNEWNLNGFFFSEEQIPSKDVQWLCEF